MRLMVLTTCLCAPLALAGCIGAPAQPVGVDVSATGIDVQMSNRQTCVGPAPSAGAGWSGVLQGCDSGYPYRVTLDASRNPIRSALVEVFGTIGVDLAPIATVEIDGPAGNTWTFTSPPPTNFND